MTTPRPGGAALRAACLPLLLAGCAAAASPQPAPLPPVRPVPAVPAPAEAAAVEAEAHRLVDRHRAQRGLAPLAYDGRVAEIARRHSRAMAGRSTPFGHDGFEARADEVGRLFAVGRLAENVAYDGRPEVATRVVQGWIGSPGHRANLEGPFTVAGIGAARAADGTWFVTQILAARR